MGLGGGQTFLRSVLPLLPRERFDVCVLNLRAATELSQALSADGVPVISLNQPRWSPLQVASLASALRRLRPDIVHTHLTVGTLLGRAAAILAGAPHIIAHDHLSVSSEVYSTPPLVVLAQRLSEPLLRRRTDMYVSPAQAVGEASAGAKGWPAGRLRVLPNPVDCRAFVPPEDRARWRRALGLPERFTVTTFSRLVPQKRPGDVLRVAEQVVARFPEAQFLLAGSGPLEERLREQIASAGMADRVRLLGFRRDTAALLAASDVYLSVSSGEALSVSILEALASGLPVVATAVGGTVEQVLEGRTGYLARVGDVARFADALVELGEHPELRRALGAAARAHALDNYDTPIVADRLARLYGELLAR